MNKREAEDYTRMLDRLRDLGITYDDANALRRISMTLRRWHEMECGTENGCVERDETTNKPYWLNSHTGKRNSVPMVDREKGARKRLATIMARYPTLTAYVQTDPRGCALYVLTTEQLKGEHAIDSIYNRGIAIG